MTNQFENQNKVTEKSENEFSKYVIYFLYEAFEEIVLKLQESIPMHQVMRDLIKSGWYPSGKMGLSEINDMGILSRESNFTNLDTAMIGWLDQEFDNIKQRLYERFPNRKLIISSALKAHANAQYELSIPVLLIQAEGICQEVIGKKLFSTQNTIPVTKSATDHLICFSLTEALLIPIREPSGLTASSNDRDNWPNTPNRHEIMHGISTDYPTKVNSYKALSFLEYFLTFVVSRYDRNE